MGVMPRPAATLPRFAVPALFCLLTVASACNAAGPTPALTPGVAAAAQAQTAKADTAQAYHLAARVESAPPPAAVGGEEHSACGQGQDQDQTACAASCGQEGASDHAACGGNVEPAQAAAEDSSLALTRVDPSQVCMVRNHFMGRPQLAVQAEGGTYYGCCAGCANRLFQDAQARQAIDPISHNAVDKGLAVLGKTARGNVLYFENEANFEAFRTQRTLTR